MGAVLFVLVSQPRPTQCLRKVGRSDGLPSCDPLEVIGPIWTLWYGCCDGLPCRDPRLVMVGVVAAMACLAIISEVGTTRLDLVSVGAVMVLPSHNDRGARG